MRKTTKLLALITVMVALFVISFTVSAQTTGWVQNSDQTWSYYDSHGNKVRSEEIVYNGKYYRFDSNGIMFENKWYYDMRGFHWCYYGPDGAQYRNCIAKIDNVYRAFDRYGERFDDANIVYLNNHYYLLNDKGHVITTYGWQQYRGSHYFINRDYTLAEGWLKDGSKWYYMQPYMSYCEIISEDGWLYCTNVKGEYKQIVGNGFYDMDNKTVYLKNNRLVTNKWEKIDGKWYYFDYNGSMYNNGAFKIDGKYYYFDASGVMADSGWVRDSYGYWLYANSNGTLYIGKDSAGYIFNENGYLLVNTTVKHSGTWYVTNYDGKAIGSLKNNDWTKVNGYWYYVQGGQLKTGSFIDAKGNYYYFDYSGKMQSGGIYNKHFLNSTGEARKGWIKHDGIWYYGNPNYYGELYSDGIYKIGDKDYFFIDNKLQTNITSHYDKEVITTNADGVVIKQVNADGWTYNSSGSNGQVYYYENGEAYNGWKGDYYIRNGKLATGEAIEHNGKSYYLGQDGRYLRSGWHEVLGHYIFAKSDGSIARNEWISTQGGKYWYYFGDIYMVSDCVVTIDGAKHRFNADGVWMGELNATSYKDGWHKIGDKWYFCMAGNWVENREIYDGGKWYYLDFDGQMVTNSFAYSYKGYDNTYYYYYGADGARVNYTGWKIINGNWCYFTDKGYASEGWIKDGNTYYHQSYKKCINKNTEETYMTIAMSTGYVVDNGVLYYFGSDGKYVKPITATGWYTSNGIWYYVENGYAYTNGIYKIGDYYYAFYGNGQMASNTVYENKYCAADGRMITKQGWYKISDKWIYITNNGYIAKNGIFLIDGKEYVFDNGYWVG